MILSFSLYPRVFEQAHEKYKRYGNTAILPTKNFFYGMKLQEEAIIELEPGKTIIVKLLSVSVPNDEGKRTVFFKVNGENRFVEIKDQSIKIHKEENVKANLDDSAEFGAPLQGLLYKVLVKKGQEIKWCLEEFAIRCDGDRRISGPNNDPETRCGSRGSSSNFNSTGDPSAIA